MLTSNEEVHFHVASGVGFRSRQPFVSFSVPNGGSWDIPVEAGRRLALNLLDGCAAAEQDALVLKLAETMGLELAEQGRMVQMLRELRTPGEDEHD